MSTERLCSGAEPVRGHGGHAGPSSGFPQPQLREQLQPFAVTGGLSVLGHAGPAGHVDSIDLAQCRQKEAYEERAAIMEFDGGMARTEAEAVAWAMTMGDRWARDQQGEQVSPSCSLGQCEAKCEVHANQGAARTLRSRPITACS